ncbi:MAG TPA: hypothetical protein PKC76_09405 [Saprospiraceae bacterium]|nr:hypothetical protein [Saprospiraceae bacterium]HMP24336.1 hypothetical protein [Saprospiraceae bacterium]
MKVLTIVMLLCGFTLLLPSPAHAVVATPAETTIAQPQPTQMEKRLQKRAEKIQKKADKRWHKAAAPDLLNDGNFRLGLLLLAAGIGLGIISALGILSGLLGFLGGLFALAGLVFIVWALIENA